MLVTLGSLRDNGVNQKYRSCTLGFFSLNFRQKPALSRILFRVSGADLGGGCGGCAPPPPLR